MAAGFPVRLFGRESDFFGFVDFHPDQGLLKTTDDLVRTKLHLERFVVPGRAEEPRFHSFGFHTGIEDLPPREPANVVDRNRVAHLGKDVAQRSKRDGKAGFKRFVWVNGQSRPSLFRLFIRVCCGIPPTPRLGIEFK